MAKIKCTHCGYNFTPSEETDSICDLCKLQMRGNSPENSKEFDMKYYPIGKLDMKGTLKLLSDNLVFLPNEIYFKDKRIEISISQIRDVRYVTEREISALRIWLVGPVLGTLLKKQHKLLVIDYEDDFGILQHLLFEGTDAEIALNEIQELRKNVKS